jgi:hypothetical protein
MGRDTQVGSRIPMPRVRELTPARPKLTAKLRLITTNPNYASLCRKSLMRLPTRERSLVEIAAFPSFADVSLGARRPASTVFVSRVSDLPAGGARLQRPSLAKHILFLEDLPIEAVATRLSWLDIRSANRIHLARQHSSEQVTDLIYRYLSGVTSTNGPQPIVDAWFEEEKLVLLASNFDRLEVPLAKLSKLIGNDPEGFLKFELDSDGSFLYWPHADVHLGWEQFRQIVDPTAAIAAKQRSHDFNRRYGAAIREFRSERGLRQSDIPGLTDRHLRRIESGDQAASKSVIEALATAASTSLSDCLKRLAAIVEKGD